MSELERETPPAGDRGRGEDSAHDPCKITPNIPGIDGAGDGNCLLPDTASAVAFLEMWRPGGPWVLTAIEVDPPKGAAPKVPTRTLTTPAEVVEFINSHSGGRWNIYFTYNVTRGPISKKPTKDDMALAVALCCDVDPRAGEALEAERERISRQFDDWEVDGKKLAFPRPSVTIDSGGGMQGFFILREPVALDGADGAGTARVEARGKGIVEALKGETDKKGADSVQNVDRIMRLPGTVNWPNEKKRKAGRVPRLARVVEADMGRTYGLEDFPAGVAKAASGGAPVAGGRVVMPSDLPRLENLDDLGPGVSDKLKAMIVQGTDPEEPGKYGSRSEATWAVMCMMVRAGCNDDQIAAVILDPDYKISGHVLDQPKPRQYAARQIARARVEATDPELEELNARHVVIQTMGPSGKCRIMERLPTPDGRGYVAFQSFEDFGNRYDNRLKVVGKSKDGKDVMMPLGKWWKQKPERRQHKTLVFLPGGADVLDGDALNLWNGFAVRPAPGSWTLMQQHIHEVLADGDAASAEYITKWAAYAVQHPGSPAEAALVFRGELGTGKGAFGKAMMKLFGQHGIRTQGAAVLDSRFNVHLRDCVLLFADEVDWDSRRSSSQLKGMVTEPSLFIEPKGVDATNQPNYLHIIIASNNDWVIPAAPGERRFAAFRVSDRRMGDKAYFNALFAEMDAGGLAAMLHDLLAMDLTGWHPRFSIPQTRELSDQKLAGLSGADAIVREMLMGGVAPGVERAVHDAERVLLVRPLIRWALENRIVATDPGERRMAEALKVMGVERRKLTVRGVGQKWVWPLPPLGEARAAWAAKLGLQVAWPDDGDWAMFPG